MVQIEIERLNDACHLRARNEDGNTIEFDASEDVGGQGLGMRPMQVLLSSLGACSAIDVISILKKQRQPLIDIRVQLKGERAPGKEARPYTEIHVHFQLVGQVDPGMGKRAVELSLGKYCSVAKTLEKTATITHSVEILSA